MKHETFCPSFVAQTSQILSPHTGGPDTGLGTRNVSLCTVHLTSGLSATSGVSANVHITFTLDYLFCVHTILERARDHLKITCTLTECPECGREAVICSEG